MILCTGLPAIWLTQIAPPEQAKFACFFGLAGQPFWLHSTWRSRQLGMFGIALCYSAAWVAGFLRYWVFA